MAYTATPVIETIVILSETADTVTMKTTVKGQLNTQTFDKSSGTFNADLGLALKDSSRQNFDPTYTP